MTREKLKMQYGGFVTRAIVSTVLLASFLNPFTEATEYGNALVFMFSHYALFVAGFALTYKKVRLPGWTFILASIAAAYWHFPIPFALSGSIQIYRFLEEVSLILSGLIAGSALDSFSSKIKLIIFGLWVLGDTGLSVIFIILPVVMVTLTKFNFVGPEVWKENWRMGILVSFIIALLISPGVTGGLIETVIGLTLSGLYAAGAIVSQRVAKKNQTLKENREETEERA